jgi:hypothetical protein
MLNREQRIRELQTCNLLVEIKLSPNSSWKGVQGKKPYA